MIRYLLLATVFVTLALRTLTKGSSPPTPSQDFKLTKLCGKTGTLKFQTDTTSYSGVIVQFLCKRDGSVTLYTHYFVDGYMEKTKVGLLTQVRSTGIVRRVYLDTGIVRTEYIVTFNEYSNGSFKLTSIQWDEERSEITQICMLSNYDADFTSDFLRLKFLAPGAVLYPVPNQCSPYGYFLKAKYRS